jgi:hypothetical protein
MFTFLHDKPESWWWAVRQGDWKLAYFNPRGVERNATKIGLFNLKNDLGESNDLTAVHPEIRQRLQKLRTDWYEKLPPPFSNLDPAKVEEFVAEKRKRKQQRK